MSEAASQREWRFYISDMISFFERILAFTKGTGRTSNSWAKPSPTYPNLFDGTTRRFLGAWSSPRGTR